MMTASPGLLEESRPTIEALGASALLSKPFTAQELAQVIAQGLTGRRQA
jgi:CheY-like chemotaxis protein